MKTITTGSTEVFLAQDISDVKSYFSKTEDNEIFAFDWETTGLEYDSIPLGLSVHHRGSFPMFIPVDYFFTEGLPIERICEACNENFPRLRLIAHNLKFDYMISIMNGIDEKALNIFADTLVMVHLYDTDLPRQLEKRVADDFGYHKKTFEEICGKKWPKINWSSEGDSLLELLAGYSGEDTYWETKLFYKYREKLDEDAWRVHNRIELRLIPILAHAKIRGVRINVDLLKELDRKCAKLLDDIVQDIYDEAGCVFNLNSSKQKIEVFFKRMGLPEISKTKKGAPSTDSDTYEQWAKNGIRIGVLLNRFSVLNKLKSGYLESIPDKLDSENILRGDLDSCGTATGRMSSATPNLQNMPNNEEFPVRAAFVPRDGYAFLNYDYSQLELRVMAHMSKDKNFIDIFMHGRDPHGEVAKSLGVTRKAAKVANFGVLYGLSDESFAREFGVSVEKARSIIQNYNKTYNGFYKWKISTEKFAKKNGYVKNLFGRKRLLHMASKTPYDKGFRFGEFQKDMRRSVNTIIQGTGADIVKLATIAVVEKFKERNIDAHFILQVHDELLFEVAYPQMIEARDILIGCMRHTTELCIPLDVDGKIILKWDDMHSDLIPSLPDRLDYSLYINLLT